MGLDRGFLPQLPPAHVAGMHSPAFVITSRDSSGKTNTPESHSHPDPDPSPCASQGQGTTIPSTEDMGVKSKGPFESRIALMSPCWPGLRTRGESSRSQSRLVEECPMGTVPTYSRVLLTAGLVPWKESIICFSFSIFSIPWPQALQSWNLGQIDFLHSFPYEFI